MADHLSKDKRSWNMSRIRSKDTSPELIVRKRLTQLSVRYSLHKTELPGKPDIVSRKFNTAIFVNGCFWHQHQNCKRSTLPKSNSAYWIPKLQKNVDNQRENIKILKKEGWNIIVIWECETKKEKSLAKKLKIFESRLQK